MSSLNRKQKRKKVRDLLEETNSIEKIYEFFEKIGYSSEVKDPSYKRDKTQFNFKEKEKKKIKNIYTILNYQDQLPILLIESKSISKTHTDYITDRLSNKFTNLLLIFTEDFNKYNFILPEFEKKAPGEYDLKTTKLEVDIKNIFYSDVDVLSRIYLEEEKRWPNVINKWEEAFNIKKVTERFFEDYQDQFYKIREKVLDQGIDVHDAHEFTLQLMNRIMFIYFVDKKDWLEGGENKTYIKWLWDKYRNQGGLQTEENEFHNIWLETLFHKALNNKFTDFEPELSEEVNKSFRKAPFLNGGLFRENNLTNLDLELDDELVGNIIEDFFEKYNFTIKEDSPVEKEVAVDPQMIGYVYESLSNVAEQLEDLEKDSRKDFGIFYTPKEEVYFMVKRSLVEYLNNSWVKIEKNKLYKLLFARTDKEKKEIRKELSTEEFNDIILALHDMNAVDPACGSGAFLVGIVDIISEIHEMANKKKEKESNIFETKKKIIQESIYGVDVKEWAINASELRLFLQLIIETDINEEQIQQKALLPNLRTNLRIGDSLVQDIDGTFFDLREVKLTKKTKTKMEEIKTEKTNFYEDRTKSKYNNIKEIEEDETKLFKMAIEDKIKEVEEEIKEVEESKNLQKTLGGEVKELSGNEKRKVTRKKKKAKKRIEKLRDLKQKVNNDPSKMPMLWEVSFAEVFNNHNGFDLVIGNPPYVRQEEIKPPNKRAENVTKKEKKEYKNNLIESVKNRMPQVDKISKRSDYYIYFYFHGLSLLNDSGTFCFITSNSWLDVGYGKRLQEFLCKYVPIKGIYNNKAKRSFKHADVNTVISVFGAPKFEYKTIKGLRYELQDEWPQTNHKTRFVTFKKPYREVTNTKNMIALENDQHYDKEIQLDRSSFQLYNTQDLRSVQITQGNLLEDGWQYPENYNGNSFEKGKYKGNKWGGKFLRAPDIFFDILENNAEKLDEIGNIADEVQRGISTGANDFFFVEKVTEKLDSLKSVTNSQRVDTYSKLDEQDLEIIKPSKYSDIKSAELFIVEKEDLTPALQNTNEVETLEVEEVPTAIFAPEDTDISEASQDYVDWGEEEGFDSGYTCRRRDPWWDIRGHTTKEATKIGFNYNIHDTGHFYFSGEPRFYSDNFHTVDYQDNSIQVLGESTLGALMINIFCRTPFGGGKAKLQTYELEEIPIPEPEHLDSEKVEEVWQNKSDSEINLLFEEIGLDRNKPIREQEPSPLPDRKELDDIVFDALGLSEDERKEVYWSVAELVKARLDKAESV